MEEEEERRKNKRKDDEDEAPSRDYGGERGKKRKRPLKGPSC